MSIDDIKQQPVDQRDLQQRFEEKVAKSKRIPYLGAAVLAGILVYFVLYQVIIVGQYGTEEPLVESAVADKAEWMNRILMMVAVLGLLLGAPFKWGLDASVKDRRTFREKAADPKYSAFLVEARKEVEAARSHDDEANNVRRELGL